MKKFVVTYRETYEKQYKVEAENETEAAKIVKDDIANGAFYGPEECCDSECEVNEIVIC